MEILGLLIILHAELANTLIDKHIHAVLVLLGASLAIIAQLALNAPPTPTPLKTTPMAQSVVYASAPAAIFPETQTDSAENA